MAAEKNVGNLNNIYHFDLVDYIVFASMLILSALTGLYYGCRSKYCKSETGQTLSEYLTGNRNLKPFPVALSLIASYVSGVTILGTPSDIYLFGTQYWFIVIAIWLSGLVVANVYLPVFLRLQVNSSYEVCRLHSKIRDDIYQSIIVTIAINQSICQGRVFHDISHISFVSGFNFVFSIISVTGINIHLVGTIVAVVCVFYTFLGGLRAVVWTDSWQVIAMFISVIVVVILGTIAVGGPSVIIDLTNRGERFIFFDTNPSMYERYTIFSVLIGGFTYWTCFNSVNQTMVQRYLSLPSERQSKISVLIFTIGVSGFVWICCYAGILVFASYYGCDPLSLGRIKTDDQILPLFVMETVGHLRGVPGLFVAGVFGAALSSLSVVLNSTAQVFLEDFLKGCMKMTLSERIATIVVKGVVLALGLVAVGFMYVVEHMGGVLAMASSLSAIAAGTSCGIFTLGMVFPWANSKGAIAGAIAGAIMSGLVSFGGQFVAAAKLVVAHRLPVFVNQSCFEKYGISNDTIAPPIIYPDESDVFPLFRLSFMWITPVGVTTVVVVGIVTSFLTGKTDLKPSAERSYIYRGNVFFWCNSLSVVLNSTAQVFLEDFLKGCMKMTLSERIATIVVKGVVLALGLVAVGFMYVVEHMGGVLAMASSLSAIAAGTSCGIFTLGMVFPWANSKGAIAGAIAGAIMSGLVSFGGQFVAAAKLVVAHRLPVFVNQSCFEKYGISNDTIAPPIIYPDESDVFPLFRLSFMWITPVGVTTVVVVGIVTSFLTGKTDLKTLDPELISPVFQWLLPPEAQRYAGSTIKRVRNREVLENESMVQIRPIGVQITPEVARKNS
nr:sodium-coupled monocarboxylate transporter 2 [Leptinotarsa decemlineata]